MRIAFLSPYSSPASGVARFVRTISNTFQAMGNTAVVVSVDPGVGSGTGLANLLLAVKGAVAVWRMRSAIEVLHCQQLHIQSLVASLIARILGKPVVLTIHGRPPPSRGARGVVFRAIERACLRIPDQVTVVARSLQDALTRSATIVPNGVPNEEIRSKLGDRDRLRSQLGIGDRLALLFLGRVTEDKGVIILLDAFARARLAETMRLIIIGPVDKSLEAELSRRRRELGESLVVLGERSDPWTYFAAADAMVLPSFREGLPLSVLEAMAAGLPVIATRVGDIPEVVKPGVTGWLVAPGSVQELADALLEFRTSHSRQKIGERAAELVAESHSIERVAKSYLEVYAKAIAG